MWKICWLVAVLVLFSVQTHGGDKLPKETERETSMDDVMRSVRQDTPPVLCGQRPATWSTRQAARSNVGSMYFGAGPLRHGEAPWHVNIFDANGHICSGAIISEYWVVTSASCAVPAMGPGRSWLTFGDVQPGILEQGEQRLRAASVTPHPHYKPDIDNDFDIALVKVKPTRDGHGIRFNQYVQPICLPEHTDVLPDLTQLTITGITPNYNEMMKINLPLINHMTCFSAMNFTFRVTENMICAGQADATQWRRCQGFEGLPAAFPVDDFYVLAGIRSVNEFCNPVILTNVMMFTQAWIEDAVILGSSHYNQSVMPARPDWQK